jgi:hypothetical protein
MKSGNVSSNTTADLESVQSPSIQGLSGESANSNNSIQPREIYTRTLETTDHADITETGAIEPLTNVHSGIITASANSADPNLSFQEKPPMTGTSIHDLLVPATAADLANIGVGRWTLGETAEELLAAEIPEPNWAVPTLIPTGLCVFAGKPKIGKSWFILHLAQAITSGGVVLGKLSVNSGAVLLVSLEDTRRRLQERLKKVMDSSGKQRMNEFRILTPQRGATMHAQDGPETIEQWLKIHDAARLVIIDTWNRFHPTGSKSKSKVAAQRTCEDLKRIADRYHVAIVLVHHLTKSRYADPLDAIAGSFDFVAVADTILHLNRNRNRRQGELLVTGRDVDESIEALEWSPESCLWRLTEVNVAEPKTAPADAFIRAIYSKLPLMYKEVMALAAQQGLTEDQVLYARERLGGIVSKKQRAAWIWFQTDSGKGVPSPVTIATALEPN